VFALLPFRFQFRIGTNNVGKVTQWFRHQGGAVGASMDKRPATRRPGGLGGYGGISESKSGIWLATRDGVAQLRLILEE
jgi:hypothetical protein